MFDKYITHYKPGIQFVVFCALFSMSLLLGGQLFALINQKMTGMSLDEVNNLKEISPYIASQIKMSNIIGLIITLLLPSFLFAYLAYPQPLTYLGLTPSFKKMHLLLAVLILVFALPFSSLLETWNKLIPGIEKFKEFDAKYDALAEAMVSTPSLLTFLSNILFIAMAPAFIEELLFRGCLQRVLLKWMPNYHFAALILVAVLFSAFHGQMSAFIPRVFLGLLLGLVYYFSGSIWLSILMHFLNNFLAILFTYLYESKQVSFDLNSLDIPHIAGILSGVCTLAFLYWFYKTRTPYREIEVEKEDEVATT